MVKQKKHAKLEAKAERSSPCHPVGDPDDDSDDDRADSVDAYCTGVTEPDREVPEEDAAAEAADEDACIENEVVDLDTNARFRTAAENSRSEEAARGA